MSGADPITAIMEAIVDVEEAITPPTGWASPIIWENLTTMPGTWPLWINVPDSLDSLVRASSTRTGRYSIRAFLVFASGEYNYASIEQRAWVPVVQDAFDQHLKVGGSVQLLELSRVEFAPIEFWGTPFVGLTFVFEAIVSEPYTYGA